MNGELAKASLTSIENPLGANEEVAGWCVVAIKPDQVLVDAQNRKLAIPFSVSGGTK
jgi:hypothetical protein